MTSRIVPNEGEANIHMYVHSQKVLDASNEKANVKTKRDLKLFACVVCADFDVVVV